MDQERLASLEAYIREHYIEEEPAIGAPPVFGESDVIEARQIGSSRKLDDLVDNPGESFSRMLLRLIDERGLKDSDVYKKAGIDRRHFSKIRNDDDYTPTKRTVLSFAIALELSMDETKDLLLRAGLALSNSSKFDIIISFSIENGIYDSFEINEMLDYYGQPLLVNYHV